MPSDLLRKALKLLVFSGEVQCASVHEELHLRVQASLFAVTGKNVSLRFSNLPPGTYTIQAWHEKLGTATQKITVGPAATKQMEFVFKAQAGH